MDKTDLEISKALAIAIGWQECDLIVSMGMRGDTPLLSCFHGPHFVGYFDYKNWNVIGPIAERYKAFPMDSVLFKGLWYSHLTDEYYDTTQKAIAMSVIGEKE